MNDQLISWLMDAAAKAQGRGNGLPMAPTENDLLAQREQQAKQVLGQAYSPTPIVEPKIGAGDRINMLLAGLADSFTAKAHAYNAAPPPDALNELRRRREERMMRDYAIGEEGKRAKLEADQRIAQYDLRQVEREREKQDQLTSGLRERSLLIKHIEDNGYMLDPDMKAVFLATGQIREGKSGPSELDVIGDYAGLGEKGITDLPGDKYGAGKKAYATKQRDKDKGDDGKFLGFKTQKELLDAIDNEVMREIRSSEKPERVTKHDESGQPMEQIVMLPTITLDEARRRAISKFPGAEKFFPQYAPSGSPTGNNKLQTVIDILNKRSSGGTNNAQ